MFPHLWNLILPKYVVILCIGNQSCLVTLRDGRLSHLHIWSYYCLYFHEMSNHSSHLYSTSFGWVLSFSFKWLRIYLQSFLKPISVVCYLKGRCPIIGTSLRLKVATVGSVGGSFTFRVSSHTHNKIIMEKIMVQDKTRVGGEKEVVQLCEGLWEVQESCKAGLAASSGSIFFLPD